MWYVTSLRIGNSNPVMNAFEDVQTAENQWLRKQPQQGYFADNTQIRMSNERFILKDCKARQEVLHIGGMPGMLRTLVTLGDLREYVQFSRRIPVKMQRYLYQGRMFANVIDAPDDILLENMLRDTNTSSGNIDRNDRYDPIIWLVWLSDEDFLGFDGNHPIGLIYENEVDLKRKKFEKEGKRLELIPLRVYQSIACHNFHQYQTFHGLLEDKEG